MSLKNTLIGGFTGSVATERGDAYEAKINKVLNTGTGLSGPEKQFSFLQGMTQQAWINPLTVEIKRGRKKLSFTFKGKMDYIGVPKLKVPNTDWLGEKIIADMKTTQGEIKRDKYTDSMQHIIYCLAMNVEKFVYCIARFQGETTMTPIQTSIIPVQLEAGLEYERKILTQKVSGLVDFLHTHLLWDDYFNVFNGGKP